MGLDLHLTAVTSDTMTVVVSPSLDEGIIFVNDVLRQKKQELDCTANTSLFLQHIKASMRWSAVTDWVLSSDSSHQNTCFTCRTYTCILRLQFQFPFIIAIRMLLTPIRGLLHASSTSKMPSLRQCKSLAKSMMMISDRSVSSTSFLRRSSQRVKVLQDKDPEQVASMTQEFCPVVDRDDRVIGARTKADCHLMENINQGLLHRAFSVLLYNSKDEFLLTQRASTKITFPSYFTNACCSHPAATPEEMDSSNDFEGMKKAAVRRLVFELGISPSALKLEDIHFMTRLIYKIECPEDPLWGEHELDYVLVIKKDLELRPNLSEVQSFKYVTKDQLEDFLHQANRGEVDVSQWFYKIYRLFAHNYWGSVDNLKPLKESNAIHDEKIPYRDLLLWCHRSHNDRSSSCQDILSSVNPDYHLCDRIWKVPRVSFHFLWRLWSSYWRHTD